jgi:hypothetical protein
MSKFGSTNEIVSGVFSYEFVCFDQRFLSFSDEIMTDTTALRFVAVTLEERDPGQDGPAGSTTPRSSCPDDATQAKHSL